MGNPPQGPEAQAARAAAAAQQQAENRPNKLGFKERIAETPTILPADKRPLLKQAIEAQTEQQEIAAEHTEALKKLKAKAKHEAAVDTRENTRDAARTTIETTKAQKAEERTAATHGRVEELRKERGKQTLDLRKRQQERDWEDEDKARETLKTLALAGVTAAGVAALGISLAPVIAATAAFTVATTPWVIAGTSLLTGTGVAMASKYFSRGPARERAQEA